MKKLKNRLLLSSFCLICCLSAGLMVENKVISQTPNQLPFNPTTVTQLEDWLEQTAGNIQKQLNGQVTFELEGIPMVMVVAPQQDRMRIVAPIVEANQLEGDELEKMLIANFHTALDGRYTVSNGVVFAAFIHPLSSLPQRDFSSGLKQVSQLVKNFGTTYSSGGLLLTPRSPSQPEAGEVI